MNNRVLHLGRQLLSIWKQLGLNQRISMVLATGVVLAALATLAFWSGRVDEGLLYGNLDEAEASRVVGALNEANVTYRIGNGGTAIFVPQNKVYLMRMQLAAKGIPRSGGGVGFEIFDKPNFGISDFVQHANYIRAVQGELARTISEVDSIEAARVLVVMPENRLLAEAQKQHATASVFVRTRGSATLPIQTVNAIRFLVANSVEGLQSNWVTVVDNQGNVLSENQEPDSIIGMTTTQLAARKNLESYLTRKAEGMLEQVLGPGQAVVRVSADINLDSLTTTEEKYDPDGQVIRTQTTDDENTDTATASAHSTAAGVSASTTTETNSVAGGSPSTRSNTRKKTTTNEYEINKTTSNLMQTPGGIKRLTAAVFIAAQTSGTGTNRVVTPRSAEELQKLRRIVQSALGIQENTQTRNDEITLEEIPFNDQVAVELNQKLDTQQRRQFWLELARKSLFPGIALALAFAFWRLVKKTAPEEIPIGIPLTEYAVSAGALPGSPNGNGNGHSNGHGNGQSHASPFDARRGKNQSGGAVTVDVLNQLIRENPNNMTQAIRTWMTRGNNN